MVIPRRQFLRQMGGVTITVAFAPLAACDSTLVAPLVEGQDVPFLTPVGQFFVRNGAEISVANWRQPDIAPAGWALSIEGLVAQPVTVRYADLEAEIAAGRGVRLLKTLRCVIDSNEVQGLIGTAVWTGVPIRLFLDRAGVDRGAARRLRLFGDDGFRNNLPLARIYDAPDLPEPLLVTHVNDEPLPPEHGGPVRLVVHESYGFKNVKWLVRAEATAEDDAFGTYQDAGFADDGVMRTVSRVTRPLQRSSVPAGRVLAVGFAVSGFAPVERVELALDGGDFAPVELVPFEDIAATEPLVATAQQVEAGVPYPFRAVWVKWRAELSLAPGPHTLRLRATDAAGNVQPETDADISDGINAIPTVEFTAV
jgi:DMSO/TMAO reductase YedYZ molybdopterin-dependent catalytic subunit